MKKLTVFAVTAALVLGTVSVSAGSVDNTVTIGGDFGYEDDFGQYGGSLWDDDQEDGTDAYGQYAGSLWDEEEQSGTEVYGHYAGPLTGETTDQQTEVYQHTSGSLEGSDVPTWAVPVYRFYSEEMTDFFYTASRSEKKLVEADYRSGDGLYRFQGICGYVDEKRDGYNKPVYRFWNESTGDHFYTASPTEKRRTEQEYRDGIGDYVYEGIAWFVPKTSDTPVYRFFNEEDCDHYYTDDVAMKNRLIERYNEGIGKYEYQGIAWYWYGK